MHKQTIIAIVNEKGGTGKTTTSVNLSAALGMLGKKVLLVDLDGQAASSRWLGVENDHRMAETLCRGNGLVPIPNVIPGVSLAPASGKLDSVAHDLRPTQGGQLRKALSEMTGFDFILIDCPPSLGNRLLANALMAATHVIVPVETSILALDGLKILLTTLQDVRDGFDHDIVLGGVLACRYDGRTRLSRLVLAELRRALPGKVFQTVIRENVRMQECPASGQSILTFAPDCHAAQDYVALAEEMLERPAAWREPVPDAAQDGQDSTAAEEYLSVDDLRDRAAARVRESSGMPKPLQPATPEAQTPQPPQDPGAAGHMPDADHWQHRADEAERAVPAQVVAAVSPDHQALPAMIEPVVAAAPPHQPDQMNGYLDRLTQAAQRVEAKEQAEVEPPEDEPPAILQEDAEDHPALQAYLDQMRKEGKLPQAEGEAGADQAANLNNNSVWSRFLVGSSRAN